MVSVCGAAVKRAAAELVFEAIAGSVDGKDFTVVEEPLFRTEVYPDFRAGRGGAGLCIRDNHGPAKKRISASGARYRPGLADRGVSLASVSFSDMSAWRYTSVVCTRSCPSQSAMVAVFTPARSNCMAWCAGGREV